MAKSNARSRLVRVAVYDDKFPFYGKRDYQPEIKNLGKKDIIIYPPVRDLFKVDVGDFLTVGKRDFRIVSIVENDSSETFDMGSCSQRGSPVKRGDSMGGVLTRGSTAFYSIHFKTKNDVGKELKNNVVDIIDDSSIRVRTQQDTSGQVEEFFSI